MTQVIQELIPELSINTDWIAPGFVFMPIQK